MLSPKELVVQAAEHGVKHLALTDINNTSCAVEFCNLCLAYEIQPLLGIEFRLGSQLIYIGLARNGEGWYFLNRLLTDHLVYGKPLPHRCPFHPSIFALYPLARDVPMEKLHPHEYYGVRPWNLGRAVLRQLPSGRVIWWLPVTFGSEKDHLTHRFLRCMQQRVTYTTLDRHQLADPRERFMEGAQLTVLKRQCPTITANTMDVINRCPGSYFGGEDPNLKQYTKAAITDRHLLRSLAYQGLRHRYRAAAPGLFSRLDYELAMIHQLDFTGYFLLVWDIIRYAKSRGLPHVGRGSGANSLVAYCLRITNVDPMELNLYFERFINPYRPRPPDFDLDFNWTDRDEVTRYVIDRYGVDRVALLATYQTFKGRSIVREMGKVMGLPKQELDLIIQEPLARGKHHPLASTIFQLGKRIQKFPQHLSIHAGGLVVAKDPLARSGAMQAMPKGLPITHFNMHHGEQIGFHKFDLLSQRGMGHIQDAVRTIQAQYGRRVDIDDLTMIKRDAPTLRQLSSGQAIGCFYIESPAMRGLLTKMRCRNYPDLVAAASIIRPGVAKSGMMQAYIHRRAGVPFRYLHDHFKALHDTYGVMVYQEDVMQIVHAFADFDLYQADLLRRMMTGKHKSASSLQRLKHLFYRQALAKGHAKSLIGEVWRQISSFSGYAFCKAHSASYAAESMQSLYLKAHYPAAFLVAVINNFGGFYDTEVYVRELQKTGVVVLPPCLNQSHNLTRIVNDQVYLGFVHIKQLRKKTVERIAAARQMAGPFDSLSDALDRLSLPAGQWQILIRCGALDFTEQPRERLLRKASQLRYPHAPVVPTLFQSRPDLSELPYDDPPPQQKSFDEIELFGFSLRSPFDLLAEEQPGHVMAKEMLTHAGKAITMIGYFVIKKPVTTIGGKHMCFGAFYDSQFDFFDTVHFPLSLDRYPLHGKGIYWLHGRVMMEFGFPTLEVTKCKKLKLIHEPLASPREGHW